MKLRNDAAGSSIQRVSAGDRASDSSARDSRPSIQLPRISDSVTQRRRPSRRCGGPGQQLSDLASQRRRSGQRFGGPGQRFQNSAIQRRRPGQRFSGPGTLRARLALLPHAAGAARSESATTCADYAVGAANAERAAGDMAAPRVTSAASTAGAPPAPRTGTQQQQRQQQQVEANGRPRQRRSRFMGAGGAQTA